MNIFTKAQFYSIKIITALGLLALCFGVCAQQRAQDTSKKANLYATQILVQDNDRNNPDHLKQAFAQILSNNSGQSIASVLRNPIFNDINLRTGLKRSYLERVPSHLSHSNSEFKYWFHAVMKDDFVESVLRNGGFDLWPKQRPTTTLWLATENLDGDLKFSANPAFKYWLEKWSKSHGVQLQMIDPTELDGSQIQPSFVKNLSHRLVSYAKQNHNSNNVAAVFLQNRGDSIKARYGFSSNNSDFRIKHTSENPENLDSIFYQVIADLSNHNASQQIIRHSDVQHHTVQILVRNLENYGSAQALNSYLNSLSVIKNFEIIKATPSSQTLRANVKINNQALTRLFESSKRLSSTQDNSIHQLVFNWRSTGIN